MLDDGYDISEYRNVHPDYGTLADFRQFVRAAHARGIRVITELVINHTSDRASSYGSARRAKRARRTGISTSGRIPTKKYTDTRIIFLDTERSNWTWDPVAGAYSGTASILISLI